MPVLGESSEHTKPRRQRYQLSNPIQETTDPSSSLFVPPNRTKPTISSFLHPESPNEHVPTTMNPTKKKHFASSRFRGLGCTASASEQVSVPAVIRASADWEKRKVKKKKQKRGGGNQTVGVDGGGSSFGGCNSGSSCVVAEDAWCGPGIGFSAADADCVVVGRRSLSARGTIDGDNFGPRERHCVSRRTVNPEEFVLDSDPTFGTPTHLGSEAYVPGPRRYRHIRHPSPEGLAEIMMLHTSLVMGGRLDALDRYRGWRLDIDNMTYEQLLELGDRIGYVSTGLKGDQIAHCIRKIKLTNLNDLVRHFAAKADRKCSICQEEFEEGNELGKLNCGHGYHMECIKQWLGQKNTCPVCKSEAVDRS
ncbi:uncharacterized protein J3R85_000256 [Psidium guajava]|nr:uncharacterized protein J3R85_000256 [Psidium guajava]